MAYENKDGGLWYNRNKKTEKQPDETGHVYLDHATLNKLNAMAQSGGDVKLDLASWNRTAKQSGQGYKFLKAQVSDYDGKKQQPQQQYQQQSAYQSPQQQQQLEHGRNQPQPNYAPPSEDIPF